MTENNQDELAVVPAGRQENYPLALSRQRVSTVELKELMPVVAELYKAEVYAKKFKNFAEAYAAVVYGRELGLTGPCTSLTHFQIIHGNPTLDANGMWGLMLQAGMRYEVIVDTDKEFRATFYRGKESKEIGFTWAEAEKAKLVERTGSLWPKYPRAMLWARTVSIVNRRMSMDITMGMPYCAEEAREFNEPAIGPEAAKNITPVPPKPLEKPKPAPQRKAPASKETPKQAPKANGNGAAKMAWEQTWEFGRDKMLNVPADSLQGRFQSILLPLEIPIVQTLKAVLQEKAAVFKDPVHFMNTIYLFCKDGSFVFPVRGDANGNAIPAEQKKAYVLDERFMTMLGENTGYFTNLFIIWRTSQKRAEGLGLDQKEPKSNDSLHF